MADTKVSALTAATAFLLADELPVNEAGTSKKVTGTQMAKVLPTLMTPHLFSPTNPAGRAGGFVMMGLGATCTYTPSSTGRLFCTFSGDCFNTVALDGGQYKFYQGAGTAPTNGAAVTGTQVGTLKSWQSFAANAYQPFALSVTITGLTLAVAIWFDLAVANLIGGTATIENIDFVVFEM